VVVIRAVQSPTLAPASGPSRWDWDALRRRARAEAKRVMADEHDAEDAVQEAMVRAWRRRRACRSPERPESWLRTIARNEALRVLERRASAPAAIDCEDEPPELLSDSVEEGLVRRVSVDQALAQLDEADRQLIRLRYSLDLSDVVIAKRLGIAEATVRVRLHRVRKRLRTLIED
jgi:RNA polymerase sigma-70 factor (ECF subfamily)